VFQQVDHVHTVMNELVHTGVLEGGDQIIVQRFGVGR